MIWLELDPNIVKPGWTPLLILVGLALVMTLLFRSMRRQFRRVDERWPEEAAAAAERRQVRTPGGAVTPAEEDGAPPVPLDGPAPR